MEEISSRGGVEYVEAYYDVSDEEEEVIIMDDDHGTEIIMMTDHYLEYNKGENHTINGWDGIKINNNIVYVPDDEECDECDDTTSTNNSTGNSKSTDSLTNSTKTKSQTSSLTINKSYINNISGTGSTITTATGSSIAHGKKSSHSAGKYSSKLSSTSTGTDIKSTVGAVTDDSNKPLTMMNVDGYLTEVENTDVEDDDYGQFAHDDESTTSSSMSSTTSSEIVRFNPRSLHLGGNQSDDSDKYHLLQSELQDLDFTLLGNVDITKMNCEELISFYKKDRDFVPFPHEYSCNAAGKAITIRLLSWNILADGDGYALSQRHNYTPPNFRLWNYRSIRIYASIISYNPDIITLQEVTGNMYYTYIKPQFEAIGYKTLHLNKDRKTMQSDAILYKNNRFSLLNYETVHLGELSLQFGDSFFGPTNNMFRNFLTSKSNYAMLARFLDTVNKKQFVVLSAHLFWDPDRPHIKSAQMFILNQYLINTLTKNAEWKLPGINYNLADEQILAQIPIIFACDTNSVPCKVSSVGPELFTTSGVTEIMENSQLSKYHLDHPLSQYNLRYVRSNQCYSQQMSEYNPEIVQQQIKLMQTINSWKLSCSLSWRSVYNEFNKLVNKHQGTSSNNESIFTNKVPDFCDTIDYIYVNKPIRISSILRMPYEKSVASDPSNAVIMDNYYDQQRYLQQRHEEFEQFSASFENSVSAIKHVRKRISDQLVFTGFIRSIAPEFSNIVLNLNGKLCKIFLRYYCSMKEMRNLVMTHDEYFCEQSYWRMLLSSNNKEGTDSKQNAEQQAKLIEFNAWNYPFMPNRKDPSDHFPLCCDFEITQ